MSSTQGRTFFMSTKQREEDQHINDFCLFLMQQAARPTVAGFFGKNNELHSSLKVTRSTQRQVHSLQVNAVQKAEYVWMDGQEGQKGIRFNEMRSKTKVIQNDIPAGSLDFPEWSFDGSRYSLHGLCTQMIVMLVCHIHTQCWSPA
jgi:hypothetical protein